MSIVKTEANSSRIRSHSRTLKARKGSRNKDAVRTLPVIDPIKRSGTKGERTMTSGTELSRGKCRVWWCTFVRSRTDTATPPTPLQTTPRGFFSPDSIEHGEISAVPSMCAELAGNQSPRGRTRRDAARGSSLLPVSVKPVRENSHRVINKDGAT